jgi:uncharacterized Zn finger protein (UPF0148 family)
MSYRGLYKQFCFERGHFITQTAKGSYSKVDDYLPRPFDDTLWPEDSPILPVVSWSIFYRLRKDKLPKLRIRNQCEDTCPECYVLKNKMKYRVEASNEREADNSDDDRVSVSSDFSVNTEEDLIIKANEHVEQAIAQRTYINAVKDIARSEAMYEHTERR